MWLALRRLALGVALIVLVSGVLLASDWGRRRSSADRLNPAPLAGLKDRWQVPDDVQRLAAARAPTAPPATATPLARKWKVDLLEYVNVLDVEEAEAGMRAGLRDAGLVEGRDYEFSVRNAQGDMATLSTMVDAALSSGADLLLTTSTPTLQAALRRAHEVPVVFTFVADAVAAGAGRSNEDHLPNVTGVPSFGAYDDMIDVVRECLPGARRIGMLVVPGEVNSVYSREQLEKAAARRGLELVAVAVNTSADVSDAALALLAQGIDALCQGGSNLTAAAFASIARPAERAHVPVFGFLSSDFGNGAAVVVARDYFDGGREAGLLAARIMRGERPAAIPFQPLRTMKLLVNLEAARAVGLAVPAPVVARASKVIGG